MDLSIIIVNFNTKQFLEKCLESVARCLMMGDSENKTTNTRPLMPNSEIIVVDNGSNDGSGEYLKSKISNLKTKTQNLKLKIILNRENAGFAKAVNQSLRQSLGNVVLLLNSDTQVGEGALEKLLEFEKKVGPAIIGLKMLNPDGSVQGSVFNLPTIKRAIEEYWLAKKGSFSKFAPVGNEPAEVEAVSGGAMAISRKVLEKIGFFDERYFMYFEDLDYCRKAGKAGFKVWYFPKAEIIHEHGASGKKIIEKKDQWRRLVPPSKIYHGRLKHYLINFILWIGQKNLILNFFLWVGQKF